MYAVDPGAISNTRRDLVDSGFLLPSATDEKLANDDNASASGQSCWKHVLADVSLLDAAKPLLWGYVSWDIGNVDLDDHLETIGVDKCKYTGL